MILCMELSYSHATGSMATSHDEVATVIRDREDLITTLESSRQILSDLSRQSADAQKAHAALIVMLRRVKSGLYTIPPPKTNVPAKIPATNANDQFPNVMDGRFKFQCFPCIPC